MIQLALMGKKVLFDKIIKMIDDLTVVLKDEDKDGELKRKIAGLDSAVEEMKAGIATLKDDIAALTAGIADLDKSVAEATETRKAENAEFTTVAAQNNAAVQLLGVAENRLNKFYNSAAYKAPQRRELTEEERIYVQSGGADPPAAAAGHRGRLQEEGCGRSDCAHPEAGERAQDGDPGQRDGREAGAEGLRGAHGRERLEACR